jgi:hypothetical protein
MSKRIDNELYLWWHCRTGGFPGLPFKIVSVTRFIYEGSMMPFKKRKHIVMASRDDTQRIRAIRAIKQWVKTVKLTHSHIAALKDEDDQACASKT